MADERYPDSVWKSATDESFDRVPQTCPPLKDAFERTHQTLCAKLGLDEDQRKTLARSLSRLRAHVRKTGTEPLRLEMVCAISERITKGRKKK